MKIELTLKSKNRLRALMADAGFRSMQALASETGIGVSSLYMFERGDANISLTHLMKILWVLDCKFEDLIQFQVESNEPNHVSAFSDETQAAIEDARAEFHALRKKSA